MLGDVLAAPVLGPWDYLGLAVGAAVLVVAVAVVALSVRRPGRRRLGAHRGAARQPSDAPPGDAPPVTRRTVVERGAVGLFVAALAGVVAASIDYVAGAAGARGRRFALPSPEDLRRQVGATKRPYYEAVGRFYVVPYPAPDLPHARSHYPPVVLEGMEEGFVALDQACTHLGCRVLWCPSSQWFECPCHGSRFNAVGEQRRGPAPRGLDRYQVSVVGGRVTVDTGVKILGPPPGTDTTGQAPAGPHCN
jgi:cytochrome b6-f complex iron-sulfur subunit